MNGAHPGNFFLVPPHGALGEGSKGQISFVNFNYKVNFKDFYTKLCVFSQMKDTKHIRRDFYSVARVMPQGWGAGVPRWSIFFSNMVMWHIKSTGMASRTECK